MVTICNVQNVSVHQKPHTKRCSSMYNNVYFVGIVYWKWITFYIHVSLLYWKPIHHQGSQVTHCIVSGLTHNLLSVQKKLRIFSEGWNTGFYAKKGEDDFKIFSFVALRACHMCGAWEPGIISIHSQTVVHSAYRGDIYIYIQLCVNDLPFTSVYSQHSLLDNSQST